ncbi:MAG: MarC family protein [archaeon]
MNFVLIEQLAVVFGTLFAIVNPFSTSLIFTKLTEGMNLKEIHKLAIKASFAAFLTLVIFLFIGNYILDFFGITIYAFRVAGGLYLSWIGFEMLSPKLRRRAENYDDDRESIAVIPLAIPLLSGPGALTTVLVLSSEVSYLIILLAVFFVCIVSWIVLHYSNLIQKSLGKVGTSVLERLMGLIVLVVAVQFVFNGITGYLLTI